MALILKWLKFVNMTFSDSFYLYRKWLMVKMILVIYAEVWTWNRSTPLNCYNTSKVSQTADNHKGQIHHHQIHFFFIFNIKTIIKISYIIFYDNLYRTHDSSNSFCWRMGLCANFRRRCLWGVSINYKYDAKHLFLLWDPEYLLLG